MTQPGGTDSEFVLRGAEGPTDRQTTCWWLSERGVVALALLLEAHEYTMELQRSPWDFAVEIGALQAAGPTTSALRWLVCKSYVEHARETTMYGDLTRTFQRSAGLQFSRKTCFVLTEAGAAFARSALAKFQPHDDRVEFALIKRDGHADHGLKPTWDCERQELRLGAVVVKQFKVPAINQELILMAFEEEGWPVRIDDPLSPHPEQDPKRRLHDTITSLNRNQRRPLIRFLGDGSGQGVRWELPCPSDNGYPDGDTLR
jgi:hypothetical protein